ncbi:MAG: ferrochelatase [Lapillicoccus sp.]
MTASPTPTGDDLLQPYDAVLLLSFGGPEGPDEVLPFLRRVTAGRGIPDERLADVGRHYELFGGRSPINDQNRALIAGLEAELSARDIHLPVLWGNRNSPPFLADTIREAGARGLHRLVVVTTSAYSSYSSCRQYRENLAEAVLAARDDGLVVLVDKIGPYARRAPFVATNARLVIDAMRPLANVPDEELALLFVTHSIPDTMDETSGPGDGEGRLYQEQHHAVAEAVTQEVERVLGRRPAPEVVYCSRSGPPTQAWLEPDVNDRLEELAKEGVRTVVVAPIGFVSDHMEVAYDLDTEALETAERLGLTLVRVPTVGVDREFVAGLVDLVVERATEARGGPAPAGEGVRPSVCLPGCCPNLRTALPALCGSD